MRSYQKCINGHTRNFLYNVVQYGNACWEVTRRRTFWLTENLPDISTYSRGWWEVVMKRLESKVREGIVSESGSLWPVEQETRLRRTRSVFGRLNGWRSYEIFDRSYEKGVNRGIEWRSKRRDTNITVVNTVNSEENFGFYFIGVGDDMSDVGS